jgi:hypothetical protein
VALEMRSACERCEAPLDPTGIAFICAFECTLCASCAAKLDHVCPNCGGELVPRPRPLMEARGEDSASRAERGQARPAR